jgi:hypothetical protein
LGEQRAGDLVGPAPGVGGCPYDLCQAAAGVGWA